MKILMAAMGLDIGGAETHIVELSKELKSEGHDVIVVSNGGGSPPPAQREGYDGGPPDSAAGDRAGGP